jgi:hypothetical protein
MHGAAETKQSTTLAKTIAATAMACMLSLAAGNAFALSQIAPAFEDQSAEHQEPAEEFVLEAFEGTTLPSPGPAIDPSGWQAESGTEAAPSPETGTGTGDAQAPAQPAQQPAAKADDAPVEIIHDLSTLPAPVKAMREQIVEAAASGDIERLRPLFGSGDTQTNVMNNEFEDPIDALKNFSGDAEGQELLAIMLDILSTGTARFDAGTPDEAYVWPYFAGKPLKTLTPPERVDLLRIVTAGDLAGMEENGNYNFFRLGIAPDGKWKFFSGGD